MANTAEPLDLRDNDEAMERYKAAADAKGMTLANWLKTAAREWEAGKRAARVPASESFLFRAEPEAMARYKAAAAKGGLSMAEWLRQAAEAAATDGKSPFEGLAAREMSGRLPRKTPESLLASGAIKPASELPPPEPRVPKGGGLITPGFVTPHGTDLRVPVNMPAFDAARLSKKHQARKRAAGAKRGGE